MQIIWHGQSCFKIIAQKEKNNSVGVVIDPFAKNVGIRIPKLEADIILLSDSCYEYNVKDIKGQPFLINNVGEYEIKNVFIQGIPSFYDAPEKKIREKDIIYIIEAEGISLCHLGNLKQKELESQQLEKIGNVDILFIPVGENGTISVKETIKIISQIEPSIVIPMCYQIPKLRLKLNSLDKFLKTMGIEKIEPIPKLSIKKKDILSDGTKVVVLGV